jgi:YidC/Oxa1 family membrane protein insertase
METETITGLLFIEPLYQLAYNLLIIFYRLLGNDLGVAIIAFTLALRSATLPFTLRQIKNAKKSKEFQKKYKELQKKHKQNKEQLTKELTKLQSEYLPAQIGGCLPLILQLIFFFQIFYVVRNAVQVGVASFNRINYSFVPEFAENTVFDINFFGINLGKSPTEIGFDNLEAVAPYLLLVGFVGLAQFAASKVSLQLTGAALTPEEKKEQEEKKQEREKKKKDGKETEEFSFAEAMQQSSRQMVFFLPVMTMFFAINFPAGLSLYWAVSSGFAIVQQLVIKREQTMKLLRKLLGRELEPNHPEKIQEAEIVKPAQKQNTKLKKKKKKKSKKRKRKK